MYFAERFYLQDSNSEWNEITEIIIDNSFNSIGSYQFYGFDMVNNVEISEAVTTIGVGAFGGCNALETITIPFVGKSKDANYQEAVFGFIFSYTDAFINKNYHSTPTNTIWQYSKEIYSTSYYYYIPTTIKKVIITDQEVLPVAAFNNCTFISDITLPDNLKTINSYAFNAFTTLDNIDLPKTLETIGSYAFNGCTVLTSIELPTSLKEIKTYAFNGCT